MRRLERDRREMELASQRVAHAGIQQIVAQEVSAARKWIARHGDRGAGWCMLDAIRAERTERPDDAMDRDQPDLDVRQHGGGGDRAAARGPRSDPSRWPSPRGPRRLPAAAVDQPTAHPP